MKKFALGILLVVLAALTGGFFWWRWATGAVAPESKIKNEKLPARNASQSDAGGKNEEKVFVVKQGEGISSIGQRLYEEELIRNHLAFKILIAKEGLTKKIQAGDFRLNPSMNMEEIVQELTHGTMDVWITIPEGWRTEQIADAINFQFPISNSQFLEAVKDYDYEGYLFPDTYLIPKEATTGAIIKIFLKNFEKKFNEELQQEAEKQGLTTKQVLTLASIVEREARHDEDRPIIAGILLKRWKNDWPLQTDATVQYAVSSVACRISHVACEWWPKNLTKENLKIDSPYNTYQNKGLPPGPICNPGSASIEAVIRPRRTDYWYYLSDPQGQMHYAKTDEEHRENINNYLK